MSCRGCLCQANELAETHLPNAVALVSLAKRKKMLAEQVQEFLLMDLGVSDLDLGSQFIYGIPCFNLHGIFFGCFLLGRIFWVVDLAGRKEFVLIFNLLNLCDVC